MDDILLVDKPTGMTSFGVVARVRRVLSQVAGKKIKVGHTGTLDPFATGLMILLVGKGTKRSNEFLKLDKVYEAEIVLGATSTTGDPEGEITETANRTDEITKTELEAALVQFTGEIQQVPPAFSAIKINGQRAYKLARKGEEVIMPARTVAVYNLELIQYSYPVVRIRAHVSSGTYIRTLAEDIGQTLGVGAYCRELRRTKVGDYLIEQATSLNDLGITS